MTEISGDSVRIGVKAPADVVVDRRKVWEEKQQDAALTELVAQSQELGLYEAPAPPTCGHTSAFQAGAQNQV